jgi:hypothetical protein
MNKIIELKEAMLLPFGSHLRDVWRDPREALRVTRQ